VLEATAFMNLTELQLAITMGEQRAQRYVNGEDIAVPLARTPGTLETLTNEGLRSRLELKSLDEASRSARHASKALGAGQLPRIEAFGDVTYANPNQRYFPPQQEWQATWSVGAAATWTVGDILAQGASAREMSAQAHSLNAQRSAMANGIRQEVAAFFLARTEAEGALSASRRELAAAEEAYRVATDLYRVGQSTTTEVIEAETDLLSARLNELNARIRLRVAEVRLRHAAGRDISVRN
jgi:outer membrane protein TolC